MSATNPQLSQAFPLLVTKEIQDLYIRQNFQSLQRYFSSQNQLVNFNFFELNLTEAVTNATLNHNLRYTPKDIVITQITGSGTVEFLFGSFNSTSISYSSTGACRVRFFVGTYFLDTSTVQAQKTDIQSVAATPEAGGSPSVVYVTGDYTLAGSEYLVKVTTANQGGGPTATIELPVGVLGMIARIQKADANTAPVSFVVNSSQKAKSQIVPPLPPLTVQYRTVEMVFDGTNWCVYNIWSGS